MSSFQGEEVSGLRGIKVKIWVRVIRVKNFQGEQVSGRTGFREREDNFDDTESGSSIKPQQKQKLTERRLDKRRLNSTCSFRCGGLSVEGENVTCDRECEHTPVQQTGRGHAQCRGCELDAQPTRRLRREQLGLLHTIANEDPRTLGRRPDSEEQKEHEDNHLCARLLIHQDMGHDHAAPAPTIGPDQDQW